MPRYLVKQPNGKYAIYSTIVDHFIEHQIPSDEAVIELFYNEVKRGPYPGGEEVLRRDCEQEWRNVESTGRAYPWAYNWVEAVAAIERLHSKEEKTLKEIIALAGE